MDIRSLGPLVGSLEVGHGLARFMVFVAASGEPVTFHSEAIEVLHPEKGREELDSVKVVDLVLKCMDAASENLLKLDLDVEDVVTIGLSVQRDSAVAWSKSTGRPLYNVLSSLDSRSQPQIPKKRRGEYKRVERLTGLKMSPLLAAPKFKWLLDEVEAVREANEADDLLLGTLDSFLLHRLTGAHVSDVTNAGRTQLMELDGLCWSPRLCDLFGVPQRLLPSIVSCSQIYGKLTGNSRLAGVPVSACMASEQAALIGQSCTRPGCAKVTYTGGAACLSVHVGAAPIHSTHGLTGALAYQLGPLEAPMYCLEANLTSVVDWLSQLLLIGIEEVDHLAASAGEARTEDVFIGPAFEAGLQAPYWRPDDRGLISGLALNVDRPQLCRAALEAVAFQVRDAIEAVRLDLEGWSPSSLLVDGPLAKGDGLLQIQADILRLPVLRPHMLEASALGVAIAAGQAEGVEVWETRHQKQRLSSPDKFLPRLSDDEVERRHECWTEAILQKKTCPTSSKSVLASVPFSVFVCTAFVLVKIAHYLSVNK